MDLPEGLRRPREVADNLVSAIASGSLSADDAAEALSSVFVLDFYSNRWFPRLDGSWTVVAPSGVSRNNVPVARFIPPTSEPPAPVVAPPAVAAPTAPPTAPPPAPEPPSPPQAPVVPVSDPVPVEAPAAPLQETAPTPPPPAAPVFGAPAAPDSEKPGSPSLPPGSSGPTSLAALREQRFLEEQSLPVVAVPPGATSSVFDSAPMVEFEKTEQAPRPLVRQSSSRSSSRKSHLPTDVRVARVLVIAFYALAMILSLPGFLFFSNLLVSSASEGIPGAAVFSGVYLLSFAGSAIPIIALLVYLFSSRFRPAGIIILIPTYLGIAVGILFIGQYILVTVPAAASVGVGFSAALLPILPGFFIAALLLGFFWWAGTVFFRYGEPDTVKWPIIFLVSAWAFPVIANIAVAFL